MCDVRHEAEECGRYGRRAGQQSEAPIRLQGAPVGRGRLALISALRERLQGGGAGALRRAVVFYVAR